MHFPFRRTAPAALGLRLGQVQREPQPPSDAAVPNREPGGVALALSTRPATPAGVTVSDVVADPAAAERASPPVLVAAILAADAKNRALRRKLHARRRELEQLRAAMLEQTAEDAQIRGRLHALEDVIAALHANLEDLRLQRDQLLLTRGGE